MPEPDLRLEGEAEVIAAADVLIAATDDEFGQLACMYGAPHDRLKTIHPGVDHSKFRPGDRDAARRQLRIGDELVLLFAGRIQPLKGIELAIRALDQLRHALVRPVKLFIVGGASGQQGSAETERLQALVSDLGLEGHVRWIGPKPHAELPDFYRAADVVVVCSHSESFGLAALEAHACGTPVVGTAVGGLSYIVDDGVSGFLVDTRDPAVFAARLKTLLTDDALRASFRAAAARTTRDFSWDQSAATMLELYECLVREKMPEACTC
jgi:D-inositol-3-phosphate glycosyltransferase